MYKKEVKLKTEQQNQILSNDEELQNWSDSPKEFLFRSSRNSNNWRKCSIKKSLNESTICLLKGR